MYLLINQSQNKLLSSYLGSFICTSTLEKNNSKKIYTLHRNHAPRKPPRKDFDSIKSPA